MGSKSIKDNLRNLLNERKPKELLLSYVNEHSCEELLLDLIFEDNPYVSWRSTWLLSHSNLKTLKELQIDCAKLITVAIKNSTSQHREVLKLLEKIEIPENTQSLYFDWALSLWTDIKNIPSIRISALRAILRVVKHHPKLQNEIVGINEPQFLIPLSPGIRIQAERMFKFDFLTNIHPNLLRNSH